MRALKFGRHPILEKLENVILTNLILISVLQRSSSQGVQGPIVSYAHK